MNPGSSTVAAVPPLRDFKGQNRDEALQIRASEAIRGAQDDTPEQRAPAPVGSAGVLPT